MGFKCRIGFHTWDGCQCMSCGSTRDKGHDWSNDCELCITCGKIRSGNHKWSGLKCSKCGKVGNNDGSTMVVASKK